jgi:lysine 2,3-aminomutase
MTVTKAAFNTVETLAAEGLIDRGRIAGLNEVAGKYPVSLTPALAQLINPGDPRDPIAAQFVPSLAELDQSAEEDSDPIGDERHSPIKGIVHRYRDRVLLKLTLVCPVYCRFCFRRETVGPGAGQFLNPAEMDAAIAWIAAQENIREVILTGGDPLMLSPRRVAEVTQRLTSIGHLDVLRWHSRVPVADPVRVSDALVKAMRSRKAVYLVLHVNHPRELSPAAAAAVGKFSDSGIPVLSQSVLLKGVNDSIEVLESLMRTLIAARIKPYYLHHMDRAPGTGHFRTSIAEGRALVAELRRRVSGLAFPHYVLDIPGGFAKAQLAESDVELNGAIAQLKDADGVCHEYREA